MKHQVEHKTKIMDEVQMHETITEISRKIIKHSSNLGSVVLVGVQRRGLPIAARIAAAIKAESGMELPVGAIDITFYRDDLSLIVQLPQIKKTELPFSVTAANVVLVDDVLYTGRSVRAAMEILAQEGRPATIKLAVLIDRGHRELPIGADYVGKTLVTSQNEQVKVNIKEIDGEDKVEIFE